MAKKTTNKKSVVATISKCTLGNSKSKFVVCDDNGKFGELQLTQGSITWLSRNAKRGCPINWEEFDKLMEKNLYRTRKR